MIKETRRKKKRSRESVETLCTKPNKRSYFNKSQLSWLKVKGVTLTPFSTSIEAYALFLYQISTMIENVVPFLPLTALLQVRVMNLTICRIIEFTDVFANQYSKALHKLNPIASPIVDVETHSDPEAEAILQQEEAEEEEYQRRARSRSVRRLHRKKEKHRRKKNDENIFSDSSTS